MEVSFVQSSVQKPAAASNDDSDFAEFEDEDEVPVVKTSSPDINAGGGEVSSPPVSQKSSLEEPEDSSEAVVEDEGLEEDDEDDIITDEPKSPKGSSQQPQLRITNIPAHLLNNWDSYYAEIIFAFIIVIYFVNFIAGRSKNESLANAWLDVNGPLLQSNFALVGDDGKKEIENHGLLKDMENVFYIWCSGRVGIDGMLIELRLWRRHDLLSVIQKLLKPVNDQIVIKATLHADSIDNFVMCLATKKAGTRLVKEYTDLQTFCPERKSVEKYGLNTDKFVIMNEIGEVASHLFDRNVISMFNKYEDYFDYIHVSDQYSGPKASDYEPQPVKMPDVKKIAIIGLNCKCRLNVQFLSISVVWTNVSFMFALVCPPKGTTSVEAIEEAAPVMQLLLYMIDKLRKYRLSKEGKAKSERNRQKIEEAFMKATHAQRQEAAQLKREEKKRLEKEKILNEEDPEKQRKWEEREYRKELKKKIPKMKSMKVKAM